MHSYYLKQKGQVPRAVRQACVVHYRKYGQPHRLELQYVDMSWS